MALSPYKLTQNVVETTKGKTATITVDETASTFSSSVIYKYIYPMADVASIIASYAQKTLYSVSFLGSRQKDLDNVLRRINVKRIPNESDASLHTNAPKIFTPGSSISTIIDPDEAELYNERDIKIKPMNEDQMLTKMKGEFQRLQGVSDKPMMMPRLWAGVGLLLRELQDHIIALKKDYIGEADKEIGNTDWIYRFDALRVPGVKDAKVELTDYNEITIYFDLDERYIYDARNVEYVAQEEEVINTIKMLAEDHLPPADIRVLKEPRLIVKHVPIKGVYVDGVYSGTAALDDVKEAVEDYFYNNRLIGEPLTANGIRQAILAVPNVTSASLGSPSVNQLQPKDYEILRVGYINLRNV